MVSSSGKSKRQRICEIRKKSCGKLPRSCAIFDRGGMDFLEEILLSQGLWVEIMNINIFASA